jgi:hypothetical protein
MARGAAAAKILNTVVVRQNAAVMMALVGDEFAPASTLKCVQTFGTPANGTTSTTPDRSTLA